MYYLKYYFKYHWLFYFKEIIPFVEDDENIILILYYNLQREGYKVESVLNGEDAFVMAKKYSQIKLF
ncbi:MAG: hypothetical protein KAJ14_07805 [Candidatus Omnitrophica bacterium]|nr:hypothetical protein [Candidatus Omnitrophota bacterium]